MKVSIVAQDEPTARAAARAKLRTDHVHISCVFRVKNDPTVREFTYTTVLLP